MNDKEPWQISSFTQPGTYVGRIIFQFSISGAGGSEDQLEMCLEIIPHSHLAWGGVNLVGPGEAAQTFWDVKSLCTADEVETVFVEWHAMVGQACL